MTADPSPDTDPPTTREIADLLAEYRQMIVEAGGLAQWIPPERAADWRARKADLLARIKASTR